jgi:hypothetical protein
MLNDLIALVEFEIRRLDWAFLLALRGVNAVDTTNNTLS